MTATSTDVETREVPVDVDPEAWTLSVTGTVERPLELDREDLRSLDTQHTVADFTSIDGWAIDELGVEGVRVGDLLTRAQPTLETTFGLVSAMDGEYACVLTLEHLTNSLLATRLDGDALSAEQGGPARLIPLNEDKHCWEHVKWISQIELYEREPTESDTACERVLSPTE